MDEKTLPDAMEQMMAEQIKEKVLALEEASKTQASQIREWRMVKWPRPIVTVHVAPPAVVPKMPAGISPSFMVK